VSAGERWPVLTVRNPWAWSIAHGGKSPENRGWHMAYRGPLWLHAGARSRWDPAGAENLLVRTAWREHFEAQDRAVPPLRRGTEWMAFGAVIALVHVVGCHHAVDCRDFGDWPECRMCSPWALNDQFHIELADVRSLPRPPECRGSLGLWRLPPEIEQEARGQLAGAPAG
jgi:hypothetical protein